MTLDQLIRERCIEIFKNEENYLRFLKGLTKFRKFPYYNQLLIHEYAPNATYIRTEEEWINKGYKILKPNEGIPQYLCSDVAYYFDPIRRQDRNIDRPTVSVDAIPFYRCYDISATDSTDDRSHFHEAYHFMDKQEAMRSLIWFFHEPDLAEALTTDEKIQKCFSIPLTDYLKARCFDSFLTDDQIRFIENGVLYALCYRFGVEPSQKLLADLSFESNDKLTFCTARYMASLTDHYVRKLSKLIKIALQDAEQHEYVEKCKREIYEKVENKCKQRSFFDKLKDLLRISEENSYVH